ncbi:MAG TPA: ThuA domain-containing protein [Pirellulales bacterium]|nr:ThuA domain-containing protein [Pirellulales bacterium]
MHRLIFSAALGAAIVVSCGASIHAAETHVLVVVGPSTHPPGTHEVAAGGRLLEHCLEHMSNVPGVKVDLFNEWPTDAAVRDRADTIVFLGDTFPPARLPDTPKIMSELSSMMDRGCGIACLHYATGLRNEDVAKDGDHPLLRWMGGYFATKCEHHKSVAKVFTATITPVNPQHPVSRGWHEFTLHDEPYYNNYFGTGGLAPGVVTFATAMLPPETPKPEIVSWGIERPVIEGRDGGRGFAIVMPHFYKNWANDDLRRLILNGIVWTAKRDVPEGGVTTDTPDLAAFDPGAIEPQPRPQKSPQKTNP